MKRKILSILLVIIFVISFTACSGGNSSSESNDAEKPKETQEKAESNVSEPEKEAVVEEISWPEDTVTIYCPYSAGGDTDTYARATAEYLSNALDENFIVVNMTGGSGVVAAKHVMSQKPDGYSLLFNHSSYITQEVSGVADFSFADDFATVGTVARDQTFTLVCRAESGWENVEDMIAYAKANPGAISIASSFGQSSHITAEKMEKSMGIELNKLDVGSSSSDRVAALVGKQVELIAVNFLNIADYVEKGDFIALGMMASETNPELPDVPTLAGNGYNVVWDKMYELRFPKGTDEKIVDKLSGALEKMTADEAFKNTLKKYYALPYYRNAEQTIKEDAEERSSIEAALAE
jgi:tripartite-type tricarboxylate transporter receptor subunit TctC